VAPPLEEGQDNTAYEAVVADNAARKVTLDDGASINFLGSAANKAIPLPWLTVENPIRVGARATIDHAVILDFRNSLWKFQPTQQLTAGNAESVQPATFENNRTQKPADVGGNVTIASFNVLNYFTETGADYVAGGGSCEYFDDRDGNPITVDECTGEGPRGAADDENLARQEAGDRELSEVRSRPRCRTAQPGRCPQRSGGIGQVGVRLLACGGAER
jgi:5'-nucleotidase